MRLRPFLGGLAFCVFAAASGSAGALEPYTWRDRVLVVLSARADATLAEQRKLTTAAEEALAERDMSVVAVIGNDQVEHWFGQDRGGNAADIRARFKVAPEQPFALLLVGKDGEVKWRTDKPSDLEEAIALVDTMPMRQREKGEGG